MGCCKGKKCPMNFTSFDEFYNLSSVKSQEAWNTSQLLLFLPTVPWGPTEDTATHAGYTHEPAWPATLKGAVSSAWNTPPPSHARQSPVSGQNPGGRAVSFCLLLRETRLAPLRMLCEPPSSFLIYGHCLRVHHPHKRWFPTSSIYALFISISPVTSIYV